MFFSPPLPKNLSLTFSSTLKDIKSIGLKIKPTDNIREHLSIKGDVVKVTILNSFTSAILS